MFVRIDRKENSILRNSYEKGDYDEFCRLLESGENPNHIDNLACSLIELVITNPSNIKNNTLFFDKLLEYDVLINSKDTKYSTLLLSIHKNTNYYLSKLLEKGIDVNYLDNEYYPCMLDCIYKKDMEKMKMLFPHNPKMSIIDENKNSLLMHLINKYPHENVSLLMPFLIENGADINHCNIYGKNALHYICTNFNCEKLIHMAVKAGADINSCDKSNISSLILACSHGNFNSALYLIENGANINHQDNVGDTPALAAAKTRKYELLKLLYDKKADMFLTNMESENIAHEIAKTSEYSEIAIQILKENPDLLFEKNIRNQSAIDILEKNSLYGKQNTRTRNQIFAIIKKDPYKNII